MEIYQFIINLVLFFKNQFFKIYIWDILFQFLTSESQNADLYILFLYCYNEKRS